LVQFFVVAASIVTSFISFSTSPVRDSLLSGDPFLLFQAKAQQDGDSLSEPEDSEGIDNQVADNENGPGTTSDSEGPPLMDQAAPAIDGCPPDFAFDPTTGECDSTLGPCPEGETRGESGFCAA
jgi:hypothetical protein